MSNTIVVGVDGSTPSVQALRWAGRQAELTGARIVAVIAWEQRGGIGWAAVPGRPQDLDLEEPAAEALAEAVAEALPPAQAENTEQVVVLGNPAEAILRRADEEEAELIVVGVRGFGTFRRTLLGSVSHTVTVQALCPVVVVRGVADVPEGAADGS